MMQLTNKRISKIKATYTLEGTVLESIKYLGVTITNDLKWNTHITNVCTKANRTLVYLRRNRYSCPLSIKEAAYKGPVLEYGSSVLDPHTQCLHEELEKVQNRAARFVTGNYVFETGSMTDILGQLKCESLKKRRKDSILILLYKGLKGIKPEYQWMTLSTRLGVAEINTLCHFKYPQLVKMSTNIVSFPRLSGTGITSLNHCFPLLKCQMIVCPNSNLL